MMTWAVPVKNKSASQVGVTLQKNWMIPFGIPIHMWKDHMRQFVGKIFATLCAFLGKKKLGTKDYHPQDNVVKRNSRKRR